MIAIFFAMLPCVAAFGPDPNILDLTNQNMESTIHDQEVAVVLFYAPWCSNCQAFYPKYQAAAQYFKKNPNPNATIQFTKIDGDKFNDIADKHDVKAYPSVKVCRYGVCEDMTLKKDRKNTLEKRLTRYLSTPPVCKVLHSIEEAHEFVQEKRKSSISNEINLALLGIFEDFHSKAAQVLLSEVASEAEEAVACALIKGNQAQKEFKALNSSNLVIIVNNNITGVIGTWADEADLAHKVFAHFGENIGDIGESSAEHAKEEDEEEDAFINDKEEESASTEEEQDKELKHFGDQLDALESQANHTVTDDGTSPAHDGAPPLPDQTIDHEHSPPPPNTPQHGGLQPPPPPHNSDDAGGESSSGAPPVFEEHNEYMKSLEHDQKQGDNNNNNNNNNNKQTEANRTPDVVESDGDDGEWRSIVDPVQLNPDSDNLERGGHVDFSDQEMEDYGQDLQGDSEEFAKNKQKMDEWKQMYNHYEESLPKEIQEEETKKKKEKKNRTRSKSKVERDRKKQQKAEKRLRKKAERREKRRQKKRRARERKRMKMKKKQAYDDHHEEEEQKQQLSLPTVDTPVSEVFDKKLAKKLLRMDSNDPKLHDYLLSHPEYSRYIKRMLMKQADTIKRNLKKEHGVHRVRSAQRQRSRRERRNRDKRRRSGRRYREKRHSGSRRNYQRRSSARGMPREYIYDKYDSSSRRSRKTNNRNRGNRRNSRSRRSGRDRDRTSRKRRSRYTRERHEEL